MFDFLMSVALLLAFGYVVYTFYPPFAAKVDALIDKLRAKAPKE